MPIYSKIPSHMLTLMKVVSLLWGLFLGVKILFGVYVIFVLLYIPIITFIINFVLGFYTAYQRMMSVKYDESSSYIENNYPEIYNKICPMGDSKSIAEGARGVDGFAGIRFTRGHYDDGSDTTLERIKWNSKIITRYMIWSSLLLACSMVIFGLVSGY